MCSCFRPWRKGSRTFFWRLWLAAFLLSAPEDGGAGPHPAWPGKATWRFPGRERILPGGNHREFFAPARRASARWAMPRGAARNASPGRASAGEWPNLSAAFSIARVPRVPRHVCALIWAVLIIVGVAIWYAYAGSGDVFHPLMFAGPMMVFIYAWMPYKLDSIGGLAGFFQRDQLDYIQQINAGGVACFVLEYFPSVGARKPGQRSLEPEVSPAILVLCGTIMGCIATVCWVVSVIHGTGGDLTGFRGGWDDSGYIRDDSLLGLPGVSADSRGQRAAGIPFPVRQSDGPLYRAADHRGGIHRQARPHIHDRGDAGAGLVHAPACAARATGDGRGGRSAGAADAVSSFEPDRTFSWDPIAR